jgi:hypothetical protein
MEEVMERAGLTNIDVDRCNNLRWKGMFIDAEWDPKVQHGNDRLFWCLHTQNCLGPDGKVADDYECNETRGCYEAL